MYPNTRLGIFTSRVGCRHMGLIGPTPAAVPQRASKAGVDLNTVSQYEQGPEGGSQGLPGRC